MIVTEEKKVKIFIVFKNNTEVLHTKSCHIAFDNEGQWSRSNHSHIVNERSRILKINFYDENDEYKLIKTSHYNLDYIIEFHIESEDLDAPNTVHSKKELLRG